ncbi:DUF1062 domain-containing protein [Tissierella sp.]|uniref:DUF1062 domain-containing protein n=1 Tax=Tissierella sp. TaxID=41274 RepID=UPI00285B803D|nr:DUF1062 domain-containing protein [Tissierella sp.]MDR7855160.1 DUF1062 domain-containing protein [Tissierella sp.]
MGYLRRIEYTIMQKDSFKIFRNCAGCGCKTNYISTKKFRINANGKYLDVWLIYQCEKCKHTYNLSIHERIKVTDISKIEYEKFESNNLQYALDLGKDKELFLRNRADIDWSSVDYDIVGDDMEFKKGDYIVLCNPYQCKFRIDKLISNILGISRNKAKSLEANGIIEIMHNQLESRIEVLIMAELIEVTNK